MDIANKIIKMLGLEPLEMEGGLYKSTYRSPRKINGKDMGSAIFYMLVDTAFSHIHKLATDEVFHFYSGDPIELLELLPDGSSKITIIGSDILAGQKVQYVVKAGNWQGCKLLNKGKYALIGTTMSPGFEMDDYEHAINPESLIKQYPVREKLIKELTGELRYYSD